MPTPRLNVSLSKANKQLDRLINYVSSTNSLPAPHQYLIAEIIMLRAFSILDETSKEIALKLTCGARYLNGQSPQLTVNAKSMSGAETILRSHARTTPVQYLKFTNAHFLKKSVKKVISVQDPYVRNALFHSVVFDEMRKVRNFIAHRSPSSRRDYKDVIYDTYNINLRLQIGPFLMSRSRHSTTNLSRYLISIKVILNDLIKGT